MLARFLCVESRFRVRWVILKSPGIIHKLWNVCVELFINEVGKRPAIWDMTSSDHSDKILRRRNQEELILIFCEKYDNDK